MSNRINEDKIGYVADSASSASKDLNTADLTIGRTGHVACTEHTEHLPATVVPAIPSEQLQVGLAKQTKLPSWAKTTIWIGSNQSKPANENALDTNNPSTVSRIQDWLTGLLEGTENVVDYLRNNLERMPDKADPIVMAQSETAEQLRHALDEQLAEGKAPSDLAQAAITQRARICAAIGGLFALPGTIPGIGTAAQFVFGMAATFPETDLVRYQMWCLQVELLHLYGMVYSEADADLMRNDSLNYEWLNKGGEIFSQKLLAIVAKSTADTTSLMRRFLVKIGASSALQLSTQRVLAKALPLGIGLAVGTTVNYLKLNMFARRQLRWMQVGVD